MAQHQDSISLHSLRPRTSTTSERTRRTARYTNDHS
jgi:hypothetical protein